MKQITEIAMNIFLATKGRQSIMTIHTLRHTGWECVGGSLHHDGNTDIVVGGGGTCRPSEGRQISLQWCQVNRN